MFPPLSDHWKTSRREGLHGTTDTNYRMVENSLPIKVNGKFLGTSQYKLLKTLWPAVFPWKRVEPLKVEPIKPEVVSG